MNTLTERATEGLPLSSQLLHLAQFVVLADGLQPDTGPNDIWVGALHEVARMLRPACVFSPADYDAMTAAFGAVCEGVADLADIDDNRDDYLAARRLPQTSAQYDVTRGSLLADRCMWMERLTELAR